jgi:hypothetical protein
MKNEKVKQNENALHSESDLPQCVDLYVQFMSMMYAIQYD